MTCVEFELAGADGQPRFARRWMPSRAVRGVLGIVHGLGEHSGRYQELARRMNGEGLVVVAFDQVGHGRSGGPRGHVPAYERLLDDVGALAGELERQAGLLPRFLYGHSLGGSVVLNFALRRRSQLSGLVVTSPLLRLVTPPPRWKVALGHALDRVWPSVTFYNGVEAADLSHDAESVRRYREDPLVHHRVSARLAVQMLAAGEWALEHGDQLSLPALLMHGDGDRLTSAAASREFAAKAGARCTLKIWPGLFHELHWETQRAEVLDCAIDWLLGRMT